MSVMGFQKKSVGGSTKDFWDLFNFAKPLIHCRCFSVIVCLNCLVFHPF